MHNTYINNGIRMSSIDYTNVCLLALILYYSYMKFFSWEKTENHPQVFFVLSCEYIVFLKKKDNHCPQPLHLSHGLKRNQKQLLCIDFKDQTIQLCFSLLIEFYLD